MRHRIRGAAITFGLLAGALSTLALGACGSDSSGQARTLLKQTFGGSHKVDSGNLGFSLAINPSGSSTITTPLTFGFGGPFQSLGTGKLPQSNFTVTISGLGRSGSLGLISTGQSGFVSLQGTSYQMPAATFQKLESSFAGITSTAGGSGSGGQLGKLGIDPLRWLVNPSIVGDETVAGASTTHIRAGVNVSALLSDLNTFLQKASSAGVQSAGRLPTSISAATAQKIATAVRNPSFDVWTGKSDKTPRKLLIRLTIPVTGQVSTLLGGLRAADVSLSVQYANLNQPQTITAPATVRPFSEFTTKLKAFEQSLRSVLGAAGASGTTSSGGGASTSTPAPSTPAPSSTGGSGTTSTPANLQAYTRCIQTAGADVAKLQSCAGLLGR